MSQVPAGEAVGTAIENRYARTDAWAPGRLRVAEPRQADEACRRLLERQADGRSGGFREQAELYRLLGMLEAARSAAPEAETPPPRSPAWPPLCVRARSASCRAVNYERKAEAACLRVKDSVGGATLNIRAVRRP